MALIKAQATGCMVVFSNDEVSKRPCSTALFGMRGPLALTA
jgi:hypothetical protein